MVFTHNHTYTQQFLQTPVGDFWVIWANPPAFYREWRTRSKCGDTRSAAPWVGSVSLRPSWRSHNIAVWQLKGPRWLRSQLPQENLFGFLKWCHSDGDIGHSWLLSPSQKRPTSAIHSQDALWNLGEGEVLLDHPQTRLHFFHRIEKQS